MINIIISADPRYRVNKEAIQNAIFGVLNERNIKGRVELEVSVVGDRKIHELNRTYRKLDYPTDILTFALEDSNSQNLNIPRQGFIAAPDNWLRLGSIVISYPQAVEDAGLDGIAVEDEISFLVAHGTNHLLGIHHE